MKNPIVSSWIWIGIGVLVAVVCGVNAWLETTTLMRVLSIGGAIFGVVATIYNVIELRK